MSRMTDWISVEEQCILADALRAGTGRDLGQDEIEAFIEWATRARLENFFAEEVLAGHFAALRQPDGKFAFKPTPKLEAMMGRPREQLN